MIDMSFLFSPGPLLYDSDLIGEPLTYSEDRKCLEYGIGMTNIVARTTRSAAELSRYVESEFVDFFINLHIFML